MRWYNRQVESWTGPVANAIIWTVIVVLTLLTLACLYWASLQPEVQSQWS